MNVKLPAALSNIKLPFVRSKEAIGVDIGNYAIKIAQLKYSMGKWSLLRYASEPVYTPPDTTAVTPAEKKQIIVKAIRKLISNIFLVLSKQTKRKKNINKTCNVNEN